MPWAPSDKPVNSFFGLEPPPEVHDPSTMDVLDAAARSTAIGPAVQALPRLRTGELDPSFDPYSIDDQDVRKYPRAFIDAKNQRDFDAIKKMIRTEEHDQEVAAAAPWSVGLTSLGFGVVDPVNLVPAVGMGERFAQAGRLGKVALGIGAGVQGGAVSELAMRAASPTRTNEDSLQAIGFSAAFGGLLGGAAAAVSGRGVRSARVSDAAPAGAPGGLVGVIQAAASRHGVDPGALVTIGRLESDLDPGARNPSSSAGGLFQFVDDTWSSYGRGGDRFNADDASDAAARLYLDNAAALQKQIGREPAPWEVYLAHQQGAGGAGKLLSQPDARAADLVGEAAVKQNGGRADMTASEFAGLWERKYAAKAGDTGGAPAANVNDVVRDMSRGAVREAIGDWAVARPVYDDVRAKLEAIGREADEADAAAKLWAAHYAAKADRTGRDATTLYRSSPIDVRTGGEPEVASLTQPLSPILQAEIEAAKAQSLAEGRQVWLWERGDNEIVRTLGDRPDGARLLGRVIGDEEVDGQSLFQSATDLPGARGSIDLSRPETVISLYKMADRSTFVHESGHYFLADLQREAAAADASPASRELWSRAAEALGIGDGPLDVRAQEQWASWFESYLRDGIAPVSALQGVFDQFAGWLRSIYRTLADIIGDGPELSPETRDIMDRLFAWDDAKKLDDANRGSTAGAAAMRDATLGELRLVGEGFARAVNAVPFTRAPDLDMRLAADRETRIIAQELTESHLLTRGNVGMAPDPDNPGQFLPATASARSVEASIRQYEGSKIKTDLEGREAYAEYRAAAGRLPATERGKVLSEREFFEAIGYAMNRGDSADALPGELQVPDVARGYITRIAKRYRERVIDPLGAKAERVGLITAEQKERALETAPGGAEKGSYFTRVYDRAKIKATRRELRDTIAAKMRVFRMLDEEAKTKATTERLAAEGELSKLIAMAEDAAPDQAAFIREGRGVTPTRQARMLIGALEDQTAEQRLSADERRRVKAIGYTLRTERKLDDGALSELQAIALRNLRDMPGAADTSISGQAARAVEALRMQADTFNEQAKAVDATELPSGLQARQQAEMRAAIQARRAELADKRDRIGALARDVGEGVKRSGGILRKATRVIESERSFAGLDDVELDDMASDIVDRILGDASGRSGVDLTPAVRGPAKERVLTFMTDEELEPWLVKDVREVMAKYVRTLGPDVELMERFGSVTGDSAIERIKQGYRNLMDAEPDAKAAERLGEERDRMIANAEGVIARLRGNYWKPRGPADVLFARVANVARAYQVTLRLHNIIPSSLNDTVRTIFTHGLTRTFSDGWAPIIRNAKLVSMTREVAREANTATALASHSMLARFTDIGEEFPADSRIERAANVGAAALFRYTGFDAFNDFSQTFAAIVSQSNMIRNIKTLAAGGEVGRLELGRLSRLGLDTDAIQRIAAQLERHGSEVDGAYFADPLAWDDPQARRAYIAALGQEIDEIITKPGQDKPFWMSRPLGSLIGQFRGFVFAQTQRTILAGVQRAMLGDMLPVITGAIAATAAGAIGFLTKEVIEGRQDKLSDSPAEWVWNGLAQSGFLGYAQSINDSIEALTRGSWGMRAVLGKAPYARYSSSSLTGAFLGPTVGTIEDAGVFLKGIAAGDLNAIDLHRGRKTIPFNRMYGIRYAFDAAEAGLGDVLGIPAAGR